MYKNKNTNNKNTKKTLALLLAFTVSLTTWPLNSTISYAAAGVPTMNAYQTSGNYVKLEWNTEMQASDILVKSGFESGEPTPNLRTTHPGTKELSYGNQWIVASPEGKGNALMLTDTVSGKTGNYFPYVYSANVVTSQAFFPAVSIPNGISLTVNFRAMATGGKSSKIKFNADTNWKVKGYDKTDNSGNVILYKNKTSWSTIPQTIPITTSKGTVNLANGTQLDVVSSKNQNGKWFYASYTYNASLQQLEYSGNTNNYSTVLGYKENSPLRDTFSAGESVLVTGHADMNFPEREIIGDGQWHEYSTTIQLASPEDYDYVTAGIRPRIFWQTDANLYIDDIRYGYATEVKINRDGTQVYKGFLSDYEDKAATDKAKPNSVTNAKITVSNRKPTITFTAPKDNGTKYNYTIQGISPTGSSAVSSNIPVTVTSGIKGYSIIVDNNATTVPDNVVETTSTTFTSPNELSGNVYVHIVAVDNAGNKSEPVHIQYKDTVIPNLTVTSSNTSVTNQNVVLTATASDSETGVKRIQLPDGTWVNGANASYTVSESGEFKFVAEDNAGNKKEVTTSIKNIDKTPPANAEITSSTNEITNQSVSLTLSYPTDAVVKQYRVLSNNLLPALSDSGWKKNANAIVTGDYSMTLNADKTSQYTYYEVPVTEGKVYTASIGATDAIVRIWEYNGKVYNQVSHTLDSKTLVKTIRPKPDTTILRYELINNKIGSFTFENMQLEEGNVFTGFEPYSESNWMTFNGTVVMSKNGIIEVKSYDEVGNESPVSRYVVNNIDKIVPTTASVKVIGNMLSIIPGTDASGIESTQYQLNNGLWIKYTDPVTLSDGVYAINVKSIDKAGNESIVNSVAAIVYVEALAKATLEVEKFEIIPSQANVNTAQALVTVLPDSEEKTALQARLDKSKFNMDSYESIINEINDMSSIIEKGIVSKEIISQYKQRIHALSNQVDLFPITIDVSNIQTKIDSLSSKLNIFDQFFKVNNDGDFEGIDLGDLEDMIEELPEGDLKEQLETQLEQAKLVQDATSKVEKAVSTKLQDDVELAKEAVGKLPDGQTKDGLTVRLNAVQNEIDEEKQRLKQVTDATEKVMLAEEAKTQDSVNVAKILVNQLSDKEVKQALLDRLAIVQKQIDEVEKPSQQIKNVTSKVEKAEKSKLQNDVNAAIEAMLNVPDGQVKDDLQLRLDAVQKQIDDNNGSTPYSEVALIKDSTVKVKLSDIERYVKLAEKYKSRSYIVTSLDKLEALPESIKENPLYVIIVNDLTIRVNKLKTDYNNGIAEQELQVKITSAINAVTQYEKYRSAYYNNKAQTAVNELPNGDVKSQLQERIDFVIKK